MRCSYRAADSNWFFSHLSASALRKRIYGSSKMINSFDPIEDFWKSYEVPLAAKRARDFPETAPSSHPPPVTPAAAPAPVAVPNVATGALSQKHSQKHK